MNEKRMMKQSIESLCFSIFETELYLDTHPRDAKALQMLREYRRRKREAIAAYEAKFGTENTWDFDTMLEFRQTLKKHEEKPPIDKKDDRIPELSK